MKQFTQVLIYFALLVLSINAKADRKGNGGDALVCKDSAGNVSSVELFDYYEARVRHKLHIDLGPKSLSVDKKVDLFLNRLEKRNPNRARIYRHWWNEFEDNLKRERNIKYIDIPDHGGVSIPTNCDLEQVAIQETPTFPTDKLYRFNQDIVDLMDNDSKAGLIFHEIVYREALLYEHQDSVLARYYHSLIASDSFESMSLRELIESTVLADMKFTEVHGMPILTHLQVRFYDDKSIKSAPAAHKVPYKVDLPNNEKKVLEFVAIPIQFPYSKIATDNIYYDFYKNGIVKRIETSYFYYSKILALNLSSNVENKFLLTHPRFIESDEDGDISNLEDVFYNYSNHGNQLIYKNNYISLNFNSLALEKTGNSKHYSRLIKSGNFSFCFFDNTTDCNEPDEIPITFSLIIGENSIINWRIDFIRKAHVRFENGRLKNIFRARKNCGSCDRILRLKIDSQPLNEILVDGILDFHEKMNVKSIKLINPTSLLNQEGVSKVYTGIVEFDENGMVID